MHSTKLTLLVPGVLAALVLAGGLVALPALAQPMPIAVELLTPRSVIPDTVRGQFRIKHHGMGTEVINMKDPARTVVARITVQPGARFPWHTHSGPVLVNVAQGELVYVEAMHCTQRAYEAGQAFIDPGHGHVHSAYNRTSGETVLYATFFQAPASGPLTITEGVTPADCQ